MYVDPEVCQDRDQFLFQIENMSDVLVGGFGELPEDQQDLFVTHCMDKVRHIEMQLDCSTYSDLSALFLLFHSCWRTGQLDTKSQQEKKNLNGNIYPWFGRR